MRTNKPAHAQFRAHRSKSASPGRRNVLFGLGCCFLAPLAVAEVHARPVIPVARLIAHRGFGTTGAAPSLAPENTMAAFHSAAATGVTYMETDAQVTRDGQVVLMHDKTVDRTTDGTGEVAQLTLNEVRTLDAGSRFALRFRGEKVPTLGEYFSFCKERGLYATPEIKGYRSVRDIALMIDVMRRNGEPKRTIWCSARPRDLMFLRNSLQERDCGVALIAGALNGLSELAALGGRRAMMPHYRALQKNPSWINECHTAGVEVWPWTVDTADVATAFIAQGCDLIVTNGPI
jgi:glycerophosphoryl diester phosphodiesterase